MYAGESNPQIVSFDAPGLDSRRTVFTIMPSNARSADRHPAARYAELLCFDRHLHQCAPRLEVQRGLEQCFQFHVYRADIFPSAAATWTNPRRARSVAREATSSTRWRLRAMIAESIHQHRRDRIDLADAYRPQLDDMAGLAAPRWYEVPVTGGTVGAATRSRPITNRTPPS